MVIDFKPKRVANLLKVIVNKQYEDGFLWYPEAEVSEMPTLFDINESIRILQNWESHTMTIIEE